MRTDILKRIASMINEYRSWIEVTDYRQYKEFTYEKRGVLYRTVCRQLELTAFRTSPGHRRHQCWLIPEYELDIALAAYRKQYERTHEGVRLSRANLKPKDVEVIILMASYNLVNLRLVSEPIYSTFKTF